MIYLIKQVHETKERVSITMATDTDMKQAVAKMRQLRKDNPDGIFHIAILDDLTKGEK